MRAGSLTRGQALFVWGTRVVGPQRYAPTKLDQAFQRQLALLRRCTPANGCRLWVVSASRAPVILCVSVQVLHERTLTLQGIGAPT